MGVEYHISLRGRHTGRECLTGRGCRFRGFPFQRRPRPFRGRSLEGATVREPSNGASDRRRECPVPLASRSTVSRAITISPSGLVVSATGLSGAGKESTFVGLSLPRKPAFSIWTCASLESAMHASLGCRRPTISWAASAVAAWRTKVSASDGFCQPSSSKMTSTFSHEGSAPCGARLRGPGSEAGIRASCLRHDRRLPQCARRDHGGRHRFA